MTLGLVQPMMAWSYSPCLAVVYPGDDGHWEGLAWGFIPFRAQFLVLVFGPCPCTGRIAATICLVLATLSLF